MIAGWERFELYRDRRVGGVERLIFGDPREGAMRVPDEILWSAAFLCVNEDGVVKPAATGFIVTVASEDQNLIYPYLVTARHCVDKSKRYGKLYLRMNKVTGDDTDLIELPDAWEYHEDEANDVAVLPFPGRPPDYQMMVFGRESLVTADLITETSIGVGEELLVVGLFTSHHGRKVNRPIVRSGIIAAMPDEPIQESQSGLDFDAYLAEVRSIGGLSGSPVWVLIDPGRPRAAIGAYQPTGWRFYLLGLIRGHWEKEDEWLADVVDDESESLNTGIAMVTPIQKALDIIDSEKLVKQRKKEGREHAEKQAKESGQVLDSAQIEPATTEFDRFEDLTRKLVQTSKSEIDEKRKED